MKKETLIEARKKIIISLRELDIDDLEKLELMININQFLKPDDYEENIKILIKEK